MTITLELAPDVETRLRRKAEQEGKDLTDFLQTVMEQKAKELTEEEDHKEGSAYDLFAGRIGTILGSSDAYSQNTGERFTQYLVEKSKAGHL